MPGSQDGSQHGVIPSPDHHDRPAFAQSPKQSPLVRQTPLSNPPASAPPLPPPSPSSPFAEHVGLYPSYQRGGVDSRYNNVSSTTGRAAALPTIVHYDEEQESTTTAFSSYFFRTRDATLRPNVGLTNSYDTALCGFALHELLENLRYLNILAAFLSIGLLAMTWFLHLIRFEWQKLVLSAYLGFFSAVLLASELLSIWSVPPIESFLRDNFGLVTLPIGKVVFLYVLTTLCIALTGVWESIIGTLYFISASVLLYNWCAYPEFRKFYFEQQQNGASDYDDESTAASVWNGKAASWSYFSTRKKNADHDADEERRLLHSSDM